MPVNKGRKSNVKNTISTKSKKINTPWLKNAIKSIGASSVDVFKDISPNIYDIASESSKSINHLGQIAKGAGGRNGTINSALQSNRYVKAGKDVIKNTIEDLKSGNFNNTAREEQAFMGATFDDWDMDDLESGTFFDDWDWDTGEDGSNNAVQINNYNASNNGGMALAIDDSFRKNTQAQLKGQKANIDVMVAVSSAHMLQQQEISNQILGHLDNISSGVNSLVEFNNSTMTTFIESAVGYMEKLGGKMDDWLSGGSDKIDPNSIYRDRNGGIKMSTYKQLVEQNITDVFKKSDVGFLNDMLKDNLDLLTANPLGAVTKMAISSITPKMWKNTLTQMDEAIAGFVPTILSRVADMADDTSISKTSGLKRIIGKVFGVKNSRINEFDMEDKITNTAVQYDQISRHAITEVIPKYLREQTSYLRAIAGSLGIDTKRALNESEVFDYRRGKYNSLSKVRDDVYGNIRDTTISKFNMSSFGSSLRGKMATDNEKNNELFNDMLDNFFVALEKHGKYLDITDLNEGSDLDTIIRKLGYSNNMSNHLRAAIKQTTKDPTIALNANTAIQQSVHARNNLIKTMQEDPTMYNLYAADLGGEIDTGISKVFKTTFGDVEKTKSGTVTELLTDVRFLLDRGINVRITGKKAYSSSKFESSSSNIVREEPEKKNPIQKVKGILSGDNVDDIYGGKERSVEDYEKILEQREKDDFFASLAKKDDTSFATSGKEFLKAIAFGSPTVAMSNMFDSLANKIFDLGDKLRNEVIDPMKIELFGQKNKAGYSKNGLFSGMQNKFLDTYRHFMREFNGKGYEDSQGNWISGKKEGEESVVSNIKGVMNTVKSSLTDFIFGEKITTTDENGNVVFTGKRDSKTGNWIGKALSTLEEGFTGWSDAIFGPKDENSKKNTMEEMKQKVSDALPATVTGGIGGAVFGALSGGSILGTLIGGPIGGAVLGGVGGILSRSDSFKNWLFGDIDEETGERTGGLISKTIQDTLKKNKTTIIGGAVLGGAKSLITGGGLLGNIVGGPIAGALIGGTVGIISKSDMMQKFLYGDEKEGGYHKGIITMFNNIFKKSDDSGNQTVSGKKLLGMNITGALGGGLTAALVGKMGLIGASMTPMGPIGGALAGLALSMKASKSGFHEWLFGTDKEIDGKKVHRHGVLGQFQNMLQVELFEPMRNGMQNFIEDSKDFIIDKIMAPIEFAVEPLADGFRNLVSDVKNKIDNVVSFVGRSVKEGFVDPIVNLTRDIIVKPMRRVFGFLFKGVTGVAKTVIAAPFEALSLVTNFNDARNKRRSRKQVMAENRQNYGFFGGMARNMGIRLHYGDMYDEASYEHTSYSSEYEDRKARYEEDKKRRAEERKTRRQERSDSNYNRRMIAMATGNQLIDDTEENREIARQMFRERKGFHLNRELNFRGEARDSEQNKVNKFEMSDKRIAETASDPSKPVENRILGQIIAIKDFLQGKDKKDKNEEREEKPTRRQVMGKLGTKHIDQESLYDDYVDSMTDEEEDRGNKIYTSLVGNVLASQGENPNALVNMMKSKVNNATSHVVGSLFDDNGEETTLGKMFGVQDYDHHAEGGTTKNKIVVVGENGPEVAKLPIGTQITPNDKPISVVVTDFLSGALSKIKTFNPFNKISPQGPATSEAQKDYEALKKEGSYDEQMREKKEAEKEARDKEMLEIAKESKDDSQKFHYNWGSIFGKAGAITKYAILLAPLLMKLLNGGLSNLFSNFTNNIVNTIGSWASNLLGDLKFGINNLGSGETVGSKIGENIEETSNLLATGDVAEWIAPDGKTDHMSGAKTNILTKAVNKIATPVSKAITAGKNLISDVKTGFSTVKTVGSNILDSVKNKLASKASGKVASEVAEEAVEQTAKNATNKIVSKNGDDVAKAVAKNSDTIITKVTGALDNLISKIGSVLSKWLGSSKGGSSVLKFADDFIKPIIKLITEKAPILVSKLSPLIGMAGSAVSTGIGAIAWLTSDAVQIAAGGLDGLTGAAKLFRIDQKNVDGLMRAISSAIGAFQGSTVGAILDIINELVVDCLGFDMFHELACLAYAYIASGDKFEALNVAKEEFKASYDDYKEQELTKEYQAYLKTYGLSDTTTNRSTFDAKVESGEINVEYMSYADYNADKNKSVGDKVISGVSNAWNKFTGNNKKTTTTNTISVSSTSTPTITYGSSGGRGGIARGGRGSGINIPYFSQNDPKWKDMPYGDETMGEAGCGPNAFAMVASGLGASKGDSVTPVEMAQYAEQKGFRDQTGTNWNFMDSASKDYGLKTEKQFRPTKSFIDNQLSQGKPIILSGQGGAGTPFTSQGHYVVLTDKDNQGNYIINDSRGKRYSGKYPSRSVVNNANMAWAMSRGGRGTDKDMLNNFPFLLQGDGRWGSSLYTAKGDSSQTIKSSGCGPTSMAMILRSYGHNVSPIDTCNFSLNNGYRTANQGTSWGFFPAIAKAYGLECMDLGKDTSKVSKALDNGFPVIASMSKGTFTSGGHFIAIVGKDTNGNIVVNDPASKERSQKSWPLSLFAKEGKNFWAFSQNGKGSINSLIDAGTLTLASKGSTSTEVNVSEGGPTSIISKITNFFSQFADKLFTGISTGVWDTNYDFSGNSSSSTSGTTGTSDSSYSGNIVDVDVDSGDVQKSMYKFYRANGFTPAAATGLMANVYQESKFNPAAIQNNGKGPAAGLFQWENYNTKSKRWAEMNKYAQSKGKEWTDTKSQMEYALREMNNETWMWNKPANSSYTHVSSFDEFKRMTDPKEAAVAFSNHFERPGKPHNETRMAAAQKYYDMYKDMNIFENDTDNVNYMPVTGAFGGRGDGTGKGTVDLGSNKIIDFNRTDTANTYKNDYQRNQVSKQSTYTSGGRGSNDSSLEQLLQKVDKLTGYLETIAKSTVSSDKKLDLLNQLKNSNNVSVTNITGGKGDSTTPIIIPQKSEQVVIPSKTKADDIALSIAAGF